MADASTTVNEEGDHPLLKNPTAGAGRMGRPP